MSRGKHGTHGMAGGNGGGKGRGGKGERRGCEKKYLRALKKRKESYDYESACGGQQLHNNAVLFAEELVDNMP